MISHGNVRSCFMPDAGINDTIRGQILPAPKRVCIAVTMSRFSHRQPIFSWSSVVLLSTLLLSPGVSAAVAATLLEALNRATPLRAIHTETPTPPQPRRSSEEEEALRAAARDGAAYFVRFESDPDNPETISASIALWFPTRVVLVVPDSVTVRLFPGLHRERVPRPALPATAPPRAPPLVS
jgi:hypothetical protein